MACFLVNFFSLVKLARGLCKVCFGRCNSEGLQRDRNVCFREHLCSEQRYICISKHAQHSPSVLCSTDSQSILANTIETMRRNYLKTPIFNDRFCRLMTDQISRALRVIAKHVISVLGLTTLGSDR